MRIREITPIRETNNQKDPSGSFRMNTIAKRIRDAQLGGLGGDCGAVAAAINDVIFHGKGRIVGAFNNAFWDKHVTFGHVCVEWQGSYWDGDGRPKSWDEVEAWGMLDVDDLDYIEQADEYDIAWDDAAANDVIRVVFKNSDDMFAMTGLSPSVLNDKKAALSKS